MEATRPPGPVRLKRCLNFRALNVRNLHNQIVHDVRVGDGSSSELAPTKLLSNRAHDDSFVCGAGLNDVGVNLNGKRVSEKCDAGVGVISSPELAKLRTTHGKTKYPPAGPGKLSAQTLFLPLNTAKALFFQRTSSIHLILPLQ